MSAVRFVALCAVTWALAGCGQATGSLGVAPAGIVPHTTSRDAFVSTLLAARDLGAVPAQQPVSFLLLLPGSRSARLAADLAAMYDPRSSRFGRFLTAQQAEQYGASPGVVARVARFLRRAGVRTAWQPGDSWVSVRGRAGTVDRVFRSDVHAYQTPDGRRMVASIRDPMIPTALRRYVRATSHLASAAWLRGRLSSGTSLTPADIQRMYDIAPLRAAGVDGSGETIVFFEIDGFRQSDLDAFTRKYGLPPMRPVIRAGPRLAPGGEAPMDLEAAHAIAPGAKLVVYNLNQDTIAGRASSQAQFEDMLVAFQRKIVNENPRAIVSNSVGGCANVLGSGVASALRAVYDRADALGEAWFAASGDQGAFDCLQNLEQAGDPPGRRDIAVDIPASVPGVTGVGGTRVEVAADGTWQDEVAWEGPIETSGSGGGVSGYFTRPSWQRAPGVTATSRNPRNMRSVPDVAAAADPASSGLYVIDGSTTQEGGTSQAAPIWAGIMALTNEYLRKNGGRRLGFANPALYALARTPQPYPPYHDITRGSNLVYPAQPGYDMATGLGTPDAWNLARDLLAYERGGGR